MKKGPAVIAILLVIILAVTSLRYILFSSYILSHKAALRHEVLSQPRKELKELYFNTENLFQDQNGYEWKKDSRELMINGIYHEIVGFKKSGDLTIVIVAEDGTENSLFGNFFKLGNPQKDGSPDIIKLLLELIFIVSGPYACVLAYGFALRLFRGNITPYDLKRVSRLVKPPESTPHLQLV